ncbi:MAG: tRNA uridine-5-carboxymethylaminomethyl(34) synthesis GTPase MnmE [Bacilli bacterium]
MEDLIVAVATAPGKSALSVIRVSGDEAIEVVNGVFKGKNLLKASTRTVHYGRIMNEENAIDEVLVTVFWAPKTFTGENIVEISCHGGVFVTNQILEVLLEKGCRLAEPGEFTKRAFLNGRIDLTQAEAVTDIIDAQTKSSLKMANIGLRGDVKNMIMKFRDELLFSIAKIEVNIDYPEYEDEEQITIEVLKPTIDKLQLQIEEIINKSQVSTILKQGISTAIIGKPNVGKSSLLNALLREDRAIVTDIAGTTRDSIEATVNLGGLILNIYDTAGIRDTVDLIEKMGVLRTKKIIDQVSLIILVFDYSQELDANDETILELTKNKERLIVVNKQDLKKRLDTSKLPNHLLISAFNEQDINRLEEQIRSVCHITNLSDLDSTFIGNARQIAKLKQAYNSLMDAKNSLENNEPVDIINLDLTASWKALGEIIGETVDDAIINELFSKFCLGK